MMLVTVHFRRIGLAVLAGLMLSGAMAWAQESDLRVGPASTDQVATVTLTPPSVVEDNAVVTERLRANPIQPAWAMPALRADNDAPPVVHATSVDVLAGDDDAGDDTRGLVVGWNCGGTGDMFPPDPTMAAGPAHLMVATNQQFKIYTKDGTETFVSSWGAFFASVQPSGTFTTDPKVIYDHDSGRWFLLILAVRATNYYSYYLLAVSDDSNPNGTWKKYALDSTLQGGSPTGTWSDYPGMGASAEALYITGNMFSRTTFFYQYVKLRVIPKQQLLDFAATVTWSDIWDISDPGGGTAFTIQPAKHWGAPQAPFLVDSNGPGAVSIFGVNNPLGSPTLTKRSVAVNSFDGPPSAEQPGGSPNLDTIDTRVFNAVWRNNHVYFAHNRQRASNAGVKWYKISTANWPTSASVTAQGSVGDNTVNMWFPTVAVNQNDVLAIGFCRSSSSEYASIYYAVRPAGGPMSDPLLIKPGTAHYSGEGGSVVRWGDYTGTVVDPADDTSFWHYNEYPNPNFSSRWRTWVQKFTAEDCDAPAFISQPEPSQTVCLGDTVALSVEVDTALPAYQWRRGTTELVDDGVHIIGATSDTLLILGVNADDEAGDYNCVVTNTVDDCTATSNFAEILVDPDVPVITAQPADLEVTEGEVAGFSVVVDDPFLATYQWRKDGSPLTSDGRIFGADTQTLQILPVELGDAGEYDCVVTSILGAQCAVVSDAATLTVQSGGGDCPEDLSGDGYIGLEDLSALLAHYGGPGEPADGDFDGDGVVGLSDLSQMLSVYGQECPAG